MALERLQKIISHSGLASRREAEQWVREGLVTINGKCAKLGDKADPSEDAIKVNGKLLQVVQGNVYFAFHKPRGVLGTMKKDGKSRSTLADYTSRLKLKVAPAGNLDFNVEGLMILTNDGKLISKLSRTKGITTTYRVKIKSHPNEKRIKEIAKGIKHEDKLIKPSNIRFHKRLRSKTVMDLTFPAFTSLDVKTMLEKKGFPVERVIRISIGHLKLTGIKSGEIVAIKQQQIQRLFYPKVVTKKIKTQRINRT